MSKKEKFIEIAFIFGVFIAIISVAFSGFYGSNAAEDNKYDFTTISDSNIVFASDSSTTKTCTIKKQNGKWYYVNSKGKIVKSKGWKTNSSGLYTYYVSSNGNVTYKINSSELYKWSNSSWTKVSLGKYSTKTIGGKTFVTNSSKKIVRSKGWKTNSSGLYTYYVSSNGSVTYKIKSSELYKWSNSSWTKVSLGKYSTRTIGGKTFVTNSSRKIVRSKGWKTNSSGLYTYYVSSNGSVTYKIKSCELYKLSSGTWAKVSLTKRSTKTVGGSAFVVNSEKKIIRSANTWKTIGGVKYYLNKNGVATYKIASNTLYKLSSSSWAVVTKTTTIDDTVYYVSSSGTITSTAASSSGSSSSSESSSGSNSGDNSGSSSDDGVITVGTYTYDVGYDYNYISKWKYNYTSSYKYICTVDEDVFYSDEDVYNDYISNHYIDSSSIDGWDSNLSTLEKYALKEEAYTNTGFYGYEDRNTLDTLTFAQSSTATTFITLDTVTYTITTDGGTTVYTYNGTKYGSESEVRAVIEEEILEDCYFSEDVTLKWVEK